MEKQEAFGPCFLFDEWRPRCGERRYGAVPLSSFLFWLGKYLCPSSRMHRGMCALSLGMAACPPRECFPPLPHPATVIQLPLWSLLLPIMPLLQYGHRFLQEYGRGEAKLVAVYADKLTAEAGLFDVLIRFLWVVRRGAACTRCRVLPLASRAQFSVMVSAHHLRHSCQSHCV